MNIFGTFNFYLKKVYKDNKIFVKRLKEKNVHLAKGLPGGENPP